MNDSDIVNNLEVSDNSIIDDMNLNSPIDPADVEELFVADDPLENDDT